MRELVFVPLGFPATFGQFMSTMMRLADVFEDIQHEMGRQDDGKLLVYIFKVVKY